VQWRPALLPTEAIFASSRPVALGLRLPCPWHAALHAIIHWQIHHYGYLLGFHRIRDGLDIARFLCGDDVDWSALADHAARVGIVREVEDALATVTDLFSIPPPPGFRVSARARQHVAKSLQLQDSRVLRWQAKQRQRVDRLWYDYRFIYRSGLRKTDPAVTLAGLWALRVRRLPFLISHLASIAVLGILAKLQSAFPSRLKPPASRNLIPRRLSRSPSKRGDGEIARCALSPKSLAFGTSPRRAASSEVGQRITRRSWLTASSRMTARSGNSRLSARYSVTNCIPPA
jgi:hypothetical protein